MKIGLLSDTHGFLDPSLEKHFAMCDEIWHAGDVGDVSVLNVLRQWKPVRVVFGNIDGSEIRDTAPEDLFFSAGGLNVLITHIAGSPPKYNARVKKLLRTNPVDILVCGHSHILKIGRDQENNNLLYINPGAAGIHGFHHVRTALRFSVENGKVENMELIELGKRGALAKSEVE